MFVPPRLGDHLTNLNPYTSEPYGGRVKAGLVGVATNAWVSAGTSIDSPLKLILRPPRRNYGVNSASVSGIFYPRKFKDQFTRQRNPKVALGSIPLTGTEIIGVELRLSNLDNFKYLNASNTGSLTLSFRSAVYTNLNEGKTFDCTMTVLQGFVDKDNGVCRVILSDDSLGHGMVARPLPPVLLVEDIPSSTTDFALGLYYNQVTGLLGFVVNGQDLGYCNAPHRNLTSELEAFDFLLTIKNSGTNIDVTPDLVEFIKTSSDFTQPFPAGTIGIREYALQGKRDPNVKNLSKFKLDAISYQSGGDAPATFSKREVSDNSDFFSVSDSVVNSSARRFCQIIVPSTGDKVIGWEVKLDLSSTPLYRQTLGFEENSFTLGLGRDNLLPGSMDDLRSYIIRTAGGGKPFEYYKYPFNQTSSLPEVVSENQTELTIGLYYDQVTGYFGVVFEGQDLGYQTLAGSVRDILLDDNLFIYFVSYKYKTIPHFTPFKVIKRAANFTQPFPVGTLGIQDYFEQETEALEIPDRNQTKMGRVFDLYRSGAEDLFYTRKNPANSNVLKGEVIVDSEYSTVVTSEGNFPDISTNVNGTSYSYGTMPRGYVDNREDYDFSDLVDMDGSYIISSKLLVEDAYHFWGGDMVGSDNIKTLKFVMFGGHFDSNAKYPSGEFFEIGFNVATQYPAPYDGVRGLNFHHDSKEAKISTPDADLTADFSVADLESFSLMLVYNQIDGRLRLYSQDQLVGETSFSLKEAYPSITHMGFAARVEVGANRQNFRTPRLTLLKSNQLFDSVPYAVGIREYLELKKLWA